MLNFAEDIVIGLNTEGLRNHGDSKEKRGATDSGAEGI